MLNRTALKKVTTYPRVRRRLADLEKAWLEEKADLLATHALHRGPLIGVQHLGTYPQKVIWRQTLVLIPHDVSPPGHGPEIDALALCVPGGRNETPFDDALHSGTGTA